MRAVYCTMPGCSTTAGCQCGKLGRYSFTPNEVRKGWLCPQCNRAHAPDVKTCPSGAGAGFIVTDGPVSADQLSAMRRTAYQTAQQLKRAVRGL